MKKENRSGYHSHFMSSFGQIASKVSLSVRKKMYLEFAKRFGDAERVLDVGATCENIAPEANYFEEMFPFKNRITAIGVEDASHLERKYPGLRFIQTEPGRAFPLEEKSFEVVFSNAVIEHIVNEQEQIFFLKELLRVGKSVFMTTPNRYFPVEHHTGIPLLHFVAPKIFYRILERKAGASFYTHENLRPLARRDLAHLMSKLDCTYEIIPVWFMGFISNWIIVFRG